MSAETSRRQSGEGGEKRGITERWVSYLAFGCIGLIFVLLYALSQERNWDLGKDLFLDIGVAVLSVIVVQEIWIRAGQKPIEKTVEHLQETVIDARSSIATLSESLGQIEQQVKDLSTIGARVNELSSAIHSFRDTNALLAQIYNSGIATLSKERRKIPIDAWYSRIDGAKCIDMMGSNLNQHLFEYPSVVGQLTSCLTEGARVRIILIHPDTKHHVSNKRIMEEAIAAMRERNSKEPNVNLSQSHLFRKLHESVAAVNGIRRELINNEVPPDEVRERLQLRFADASGIYAYMLRIDDRMLVANYFSHVRGGGAPGWELVRDVSDPHTTAGRSRGWLFEFYEHEFDHMWRFGSSAIDERDVEQLLASFR